MFVSFQKQAADLLDKESLQSSGVKCSRKQLNAALLDELRITGNVSIIVSCEFFILLLL